MDINKIKSLDLGCANNITKFNGLNIEEYYGLDIIEPKSENIKKCDLFVEKIPFDDETFNYVSAFDFLEHVPRTIYYKDRLCHPLIHIFNEVYRVLKTDGVFLIKVPEFNNMFFYNDPTHVNPITKSLFDLYFCTLEDKSPQKPWAEDYGFIGNFKMVEYKVEPLLHFTAKGYPFNTLLFALKKIDRVSSEV